MLLKKLNEIKELDRRQIFLKEKRADLIAEKKANKHRKVIEYNPVSVMKSNTSYTGSFQDKYVDVEVVGNCYNYADSYIDVLFDNCSKKTLLERKSDLVHLDNHVHAITSKVGESIEVYEKNVSFKDLGINMNGENQVLCFVTRVIKSYNPFIFDQYTQNKINQHSIGLWYEKIFLAINNPDDTENYANWEKYFPRVINKEYVLKNGFFWGVPEIKLMENSSVLFGANEKTPTLQIGEIKDYNPEIFSIKSEPSSTFNESRVKNDTLAHFYNNLIN